MRGRDLGGDRGAVAVSRAPGWIFEPTFTRELLAEAREAILQEEEDYGYREPSDEPIDSVSA